MREAPDARLRLHLWLVLVGVILSGVSWALSSPVGSGPDDRFHLSSIWCGWGDGSSCVNVEPADATTYGGLWWWREVRVPELLAGSNCNERALDQSSACLTKLSSSSAPTSVSVADNGSYPPLFHFAMRALVTPHIEASVLLMRLISVLLFAGLFGLTIFTASASLRRAFLLASTTMFFPLVIYTVASTNPSAWSVAGVATYWALLCTGLSAQRRGVVLMAMSGAALAGLLAAGSRSDSAIFVVVATIVAPLTAFGGPVDWNRLGRRIYVPLATCIVSLILFVRSSQVGREQEATEHLWNGGPLALTLRNLSELPLYFMGMLGAPGSSAWPLGLGRMDVPVPPIAWVLAGGLAAALAFWGLQWMWLRKALSLGLLSIVLLAFPLIVLQRKFQTPEYFLQPRYLLPLALVALSITLLTEAGGPRHRYLSRAQVYVWAVGVFLVAAASQHALLRRYLTGTDAAGVNLDADIEWWWSFGPSPMTVWLMGLLGALVIVIATAPLIAGSKFGPGQVSRG